jgi:hypothetical protein
MTQITVTAEIARAIAESPMPIVLVDPQGRKLGQMTQIDAVSAEEAKCSEEEWAEAKRRMANDDGTRYTTAEVLAYLRSLASE